MGGSKLNPTYYSLGDHTETTEVVYNPSVTTYKNLLDMFWKNHDPTSKCTRQYMSAIFYHGEEQKKLAEESMKTAQAQKNKQLQTKVLPAGTFYEAEDYHQKYLLQKHPFILNALDIEPGSQLNGSFVAARLNGYVGGYGTVQSFEKELPQLELEDRIAAYVRRAITHGKRVDC